MQAGSSIITDKNGVKTSEMRYCEASLCDKPWGETRYTWTSALATTPTYKLADYTFTGQYSYMDDLSTPATEGFGLMFYNARFYDPALGRFTSADTIIPGGVQGLDRYAYTLNNPVRYTDPSGHIVSCEADEDCKEVRRTDKLTASDAWDEMFSKYGVTVKGSWDIRYKIALGLGISAVAEKFSDIAQQSPSDIFKQIYGQLTFTWGSCNECNGEGGYTYGISDIRFASMAAFYHSNWLLRATNNVIHELGHAFNWAMGRNPEMLLANDMDRYGTAFNELLIRDSDSNSYSGFASRNNERVWVQNPATTASEVFADQFLGWVMNTWEADSSDRYGKWTAAGAARANWMTTNMTGFLSAYR